MKSTQKGLNNLKECRMLLHKEGKEEKTGRI
jgi:hypothetical protein